MSETENQINKAHNRKKDKFKKKFKNIKFDTEFLDDGNQADKHEKDTDKSDKDEYEKAKLKNPRAFAINSFVAAERQFRRSVFLN